MIKIKPIPANIIIQDPTILIIAVDLLRKSIITCLPILTTTVTEIISNKSPIIKPDNPNDTELPPCVDRYIMKGKTAAAVQSIDAAAYPIP